MVLRRVALLRFLWAAIDGPAMERGMKVGVACAAGESLLWRVKITTVVFLVYGDPFRSKRGSNLLQFFFSGVRSGEYIGS